MTEAEKLIKIIMPDLKEGAKFTNCHIGSIAAGEIDAFVIDKIKNIFQAPEMHQVLLKELEKSNQKYNGADVHKIIADIGEAIEYFEPATIHDFVAEIVRKVVVCHDHIEIKLKPLAATLYETGIWKPVRHVKDDDIRRHRLGFLCAG